MKRAKRKPMQRWHFVAFFIGETYIHVEPGTSEEEVRKILDEKYYGGNWQTSSLRKGKKYKVKVEAA